MDVSELKETCLRFQLKEIAVNYCLRLAWSQLIFISVGPNAIIKEINFLFLLLCWLLHLSLQTMSFSMP